MTALEQGLKILIESISQLKEIRKDVAGLSGVEARLKEARRLFEEHNESEFTPYLLGKSDVIDKLKDQIEELRKFYLIGVKNNDPRTVFYDRASGIADAIKEITGERIYLTWNQN